MDDLLAGRFYPGRRPKAKTFTGAAAFGKSLSPLGPAPTVLTSETRKGDELCAIANTPGTPEEERAAAFEPAEHKTPRRATPFRLRDLLRLRR